MTATWALAATHMLHYHAAWHEQTNGLDELTRLVSARCQPTLLTVLEAPICAHIVAQGMALHRHSF